ncbi:hypothetical protein WJ0W_000458 [Paenibacillus melissococcoides]|uniref:Yip1 domain-containing protein n=1 Tax=Paenibacillus melissococcoides TaxID=2912268 RepID=A0ABN8TXD1_9BACL|nr:MULTISPECIES: hypothetical protein [Paenibacillus]MEB9893515.1 hypothetical protein [Bacillus cereus]CAH8243232.1 hypothetical protein WJ0W_000458 [Paenibacillus melissococcoides]CAH8704007.1 hypothetical protein WDD9_000448 [Paenibacillus melissococcoides]CAH8707171.1 hypothetical protein HTL2_001533 [Paenibacillus melissococcoides]GIO76820.1 hypothetical protein J6TS7_04300 [Paenibacillus dendritiformis]
MKVCNRCGEPLREHEVHTCRVHDGRPPEEGPASSPDRRETAAAAEQSLSARHMQEPVQPPAPGYGSPKTSAPKIDMARVIRLMKEPQAASFMTTGSDYWYGVIGAAVSAVGFALFGYLFLNQFVRVIFGSLPFGLGSTVLPFSYFLQLMFLHLVALAALFGSLYFVNRWKGGRELDAKTFFVQLAAMQMPYGPIYAVAGIITLLSFYSLALSIAGLAWLVSVMMTIYESLEQAQVSRNNRFVYVLAGLSGYFLLLLIMTKILF